MCEASMEDQGTWSITIFLKNCQNAQDFQHLKNIRIRIYMSYRCIKTSDGSGTLIFGQILQIYETNITSSICFFKYLFSMKLYELVTDEVSWILVWSITHMRQILLQVSVFLSNYLSSIKLCRQMRPKWNL